VRSEDEGAYRDFVAARLAHLRRVAYLVCGDWHAAEDAASTALARLYVAWDRVRDRERIDAYARTMVIRAVLDEHRRPWRRERTPYDETIRTEPVPDQTSQVHDRMLLRKALSELPRRRRAVLVLRYFEGLSVEETAEALGCTAGTVKSQTARGLAALRDMLPTDYLVNTGAQDG
jgi:RNA polymerase sigma-70 factor (sigma-E family)